MTASKPREMGPMTGKQMIWGTWPGKALPGRENYRCNRP